MINLFISLITIVLTAVTNNQISSGIILYQKTLGFANNQKPSVDFNIQSTASLSFNTMAYYYKPNMPIDIENKQKSLFIETKVKLLKAKGSYNEYYFELNKAEGVQLTNEFQKLYLINNVQNQYSWLRTEETKMILGYKCFKAYHVHIVFNDPEGKTGFHEERTNVWFTKQLPADMGPECYRGLPGTILEVEEKDHTHIIATQIKPLEIAPDIKKPSKGIKMTFEAFNKMKERMLSSYLKN